jgi:hypothetical protein
MSESFSSQTEFTEKELTNIPAGNEYFTNSRSQRLYCHTTAPADGLLIRGYVLFLHGYCAHVSRPIHSRFREALRQKGYGYICLDFHGHGRSDGTKALVQDPGDLVDDVLACLLALHDDSRFATKPFSHLLAKELNLLIPENNSAPIYLIGHSMGGGAAILAGHVLSNSRSGSFSTSYSIENKTALDIIGKNFRGAMLFCPLIDIGLPCALKYLLVSPIACCCPANSLPKCMTGDETKTNEKIWASPVYREFCVRDQWPANPSGLSYGGTIHWVTLRALMTMAEKVQLVLPEISWPFIIFHDPLDEVTKYAGSLKAKTCALSKDKCLVDLPGRLHDIIGNDLSRSIAECLRWLER